MLAYSQHLDWHFRMKRKERDNAKRAQSRAWYFERIDWIISDEVEDEDKGMILAEIFVPNEMSTFELFSWQFLVYFFLFGYFFMVHVMTMVLSGI